jgi:WD40 repeat protein
LDVEGVASVALHPDEDMLALGMNSGEVKLWSLAADAVSAELSGGSRAMEAIEFGPGGHQLAVSDGELVRVWDLRLRYVRYVMQVAGVSSLDFDALGNSLLTGGERGAHIWDTRFRMISINFASTPVLGPVSPYEPTIATTSNSRLRVRFTEQKTWQLEDTRTGELIHTFGGLDSDSLASSGYCVAISPDDELVVIANGIIDGIADIRLFRIRTGDEIGAFDGHIERVGCIRFTPDGSRIFTSGGETIYMWDVGSGMELQQFKVITARGSAGSSRIDFSSDQRLMAATSQSFGFLFDVATGEQIARSENGPAQMLLVGPEDLCETRFGVYRSVDVSRQ